MKLILFALQSLISMNRKLIWLFADFYFYRFAAKTEEVNEDNVFLIESNALSQASKEKE